ncbi:hypothetical protein INT47_010290 [Mucor saturninus]|uniref:Uncharacterized protein n=1 Tax=Mucor saturninus TaxID=64648 RepID=A0A8H7QW54_9FUNG|nr:hypothetical protein INT47_010290 [Mucor saturninus]
MSNTMKQDVRRQSLQPRTMASDQSPSYTISNKIQRIKSFHGPNECSIKRRMSVNKDEKRKSNIKLLQFIATQQQQTVALNNEIALLSEKLILAEAKASKWKKEFKDLQSKFAQVIHEQQSVREELDDTRRMLTESEHIRSRWFLKATPTQEDLPLPPPKRLPQTHHHSHSLPSNLFRFLKKKSQC